MMQQIKLWEVTCNRVNMLRKGTRWCKDMSLNLSWIKIEKLSYYQELLRNEVGWASFEMPQSNDNLALFLWPSKDST